MTRASHTRSVDLPNCTPQVFSALALLRLGGIAACPRRGPPSPSPACDASRPGAPSVRVFATRTDPLSLSQTTMMERRYALAKWSELPLLSSGAWAK